MYNCKSGGMALVPRGAHSTHWPAPRLGFSACPILPAAGENFENLALETRRFHKTAFDRIGVGRSERGFALSLDQMHAHSTP